MSAEHGGHGHGGGSSDGLFFIEGIAEPAEVMWASIFDVFTLFIAGFFALFDTPVKSS